MAMKQTYRCSGILSLMTRVVSVGMIFVPLITACTGDDRGIEETSVDTAGMATLYTRDVTTLISDSGVTRYRIEAPAWYMYEETADPYWYFPEGIRVEQFDTLFVTETYIKGDTAIYYKDRQLWRLDRNVHIENAEGRIFDTHQLFWDQRARKIYSDSAIRITTGDEVIEGVGFVSNEQITKYAILRTSGIFTVKPDTATTDSVAADSIAVEPVTE